jgi:hypothetical protein
MGRDEDYFAWSRQLAKPERPNSLTFGAFIVKKLSTVDCRKTQPNILIRPLFAASKDSLHNFVWIYGAIVLRQARALASERREGVLQL